MTQDATTVLLIEDETPIRRFLRPSLEAEGHRVVEAATGKEGLLKATQCRPDVVILDLMLPDIDGIEVIRGLREWTTVPIVVLSARGQEQDKIAGLDAGADDYVAKPFSVGELMARIRVALRHAADLGQGGPEPVFQAGDLTIDLGKREVTRKGQPIHLTPMEYRLLVALVRHSGLVLTHRQLLKDVWGQGYGNESHYLRIFIHQLRHKLEEDPSRPKHLITEAGVGYRFKLDA